jgi:RNA polymerase sigma factor (sigma-70 family)
VIAVDNALRSLEALDARKAKVVELRFFAGLTTEETAEVMKISTRTVEREWSLAQAWLLRELKGKNIPESKEAEPVRRHI